MRFTKFFNLNFEQPQLDFVDIDLEEDTPLFLDPYLIAKRPDLWSIECHEDILSFFQTVLDLIRAHKDEEARELLGGLSEPVETCLGVSRGHTSGKGVSGKQAQDIFLRLKGSAAAQTGFLSELADCELMIEGIGFDKISDITTNIIRRRLVAYTQDQCNLLEIPTPGTVASGRLWNRATQTWDQEYVPLPVANEKKVILVPKAIVVHRSVLYHQEYYQHFVLNFLQQQHLEASTSLVRVLKNGNRRVYKKDLKEEYPLSKGYLYQFSKDHPEVLADYKRKKGIPRDASDHELIEDFDEAVFANSLIERLNSIEPGDSAAYEYHKFMIGTLEFIFYPNLIYPVKELEIHDGRKRIDISYTNAARSGFFYRARLTPEISSNFLMVECKNYSSEPGNPALDQMAGRFSTSRGRLGFLVFRKMDDKRTLIERCRDTVRDGRGFIIPLEDADIVEILKMIESGERNKIDQYLESINRDICI